MSGVLPEPPAGSITDGAAHAFVSDLDQPALRDEDRVHLMRSLRLRPSAQVTVSDGEGRWRWCRLGEALLEPTSAVVAEPAPPYPITVAFALVKGQRPELAVQKLTELGIDRIIPLVADRSVVKWDAAKTTHHFRRFSEISRQAAMQSRRTRLPQLGLPGAEPDTERLPRFREVAALPNAVVADDRGEPPSRAGTTVLVGPEGGWSEAEREAGLPRVKLGTNVLRAETAAITAGALLAALRSDIVLPAV